MNEEPSVSRLPTALIVDDEPLARLKIHDLVAAVPLVEIIGEAADGEEAVRAIDELRPDVVFLDIEMPGLLGLGVLDRIRHQPAVIFTTAHAGYAVDAFELAAVDYLVKPFGRERFRSALERVSRVLTTGEGEGGVRTTGALSISGEGGPLRRLFVRDRGRILPLALEEVELFEAQDDYVIALAGDRRYTLRTTMQALEDGVDPRHFIRVHRSWMVNLDFVESFEPFDATRLLVRMEGGQKIVASRSRSRELRELVR